MTKKETIYNALGMIEGAVCVSQKNTRDVLMKAIDMIKNAVEEEAEPNVESNEEHKSDCNHEWKLVEAWDYMSNPHEFERHGHFVCELCGKGEVRNI